VTRNLLGAVKEKMLLLLKYRNSESGNAAYQKKKSAGRLCENLKNE